MRNTLFFFICGFFLLSGCTQKVSIQFLEPAQIPLEGVKTIGVAEFTFDNIQLTLLEENRGVWNKKSQELSNQEFAEVFQSALLQELSRFPLFENIHLARFNKVRSGSFKNLIPLAGETPPKIDALLTGKVYLHVTKQSGNEYKKITLNRYQEKMKYIPRENGEILQVFEDSTEDKIISFPYQTVTATGIAEIELISTGEKTPQILAYFIVPVTQTVKLGGGGNSVPNFQEESSFDETLSSVPEPVQIFFKSQRENSRIGEDVSLRRGGHTGKIDAIPSLLMFSNQIARTLAKELSPVLSISQKTEHRELASDGDPIARDLILAQAIDHATKRLEEVLLSPEGKIADNYYFLALCYEIKGELGPARVYYTDALDLDPGNELYMKSLGAIEQRMVRQNSLRQQLMNSKQ